MRFKEITFITNLTPLSHRAPMCGLLVEVPGDHPSFGQDTVYIPIPSLLGDLAESKVRASALADRLLDQEPEIEGLPQLSIFKEFVIATLLRLLQTAHLDWWLTDNKIRVCRFVEYSEWVSDLRAMQRRSGSCYAIEAPAAKNQAIWDKIREHAVDYGWSPGGIRLAIFRLWKRGFSCLSRVLSASRLPASSLPTGGWWFYTAGYNFTRIGLMYEAFLPQAMNYMVEDWETGGRALREAGRSGYSIYSLARITDVPSAWAVKEVRTLIQNHLRTVTLKDEDARVRDLLLDSAWFHYACKRLFPLALLYTRVLKRWLDAVSPEVMIFGNTVFEGYLISMARRRGIPTVLLQHGILGDFYQCTAYPVDHVIVRGEFFRDFLSEANRKRAVILNPPQPVIKDQCARDSILFLTGFNLHEYWTHPENIDEILKTLVRSAHQLNTSLIVRVHPAESVRRYQQIVERTQHEEVLQVSVSYSQGGSLEELMTMSKVAVLFYSTVMLDCMRYSVPTISLGWADYSIRRMIDEAGTVHMARDLKDLSSLVEQAVKGELPSSIDRVSYFLDTTSPSQIRETFSSIAASSTAN